LFNVPEAVDPHFEGMTARLALVKLPPNGMSKYSKLRLVQEYEMVVVDVKEFAVMRMVGME